VVETELKECVTLKPTGERKGPAQERPLVTKLANDAGLTVVKLGKLFNLQYSTFDNLNKCFYLLCFDSFISTEALTPQWLQQDVIMST
jgi:hypothetical protein